MEKRIFCPTCGGVGWIRNPDFIPPVPPGFVVHEVISDYFGSHDEYGEGDRKLFIALPNGVDLAEGFSLCHGHDSSSRHWEAILALPDSALLAVAGDEEFVSRDVFVAEYEISR